MQYEPGIERSRVVETRCAQDARRARARGRAGPSCTPRALSTYGLGQTTRTVIVALAETGVPPFGVSTAVFVNF